MIIKGQRVIVMGKILIVSSSSKSKELLNNITKESGNYDISLVNNASECKKIISEVIFDLIIINSPLSDDMGANLAVLINKNTESSVILIAKSDYRYMINEDLEAKGIFIVEKPLNKIVFINIIKMSLIHRKKFKQIIEENKKLKVRINEIKLISRAKITLMRYLRMSESEAHRYIEKQAMDLRITKVEIARNILKIYEI